MPLASPGQTQETSNSEITCPSYGSCDSPSGTGRTYRDKNFGPEGLFLAVCGKKGIFAVFRKRNNHTMLLSVIETAETLGCSAQYVRKLLREGRLAGQKIGDSWIINDDTLESFDRKDLRMKKNDVPDRKSKKAQTGRAELPLLFLRGDGAGHRTEQEGCNILLACETDNAWPPGRSSPTNPASD